MCTGKNEAQSKCSKVIKATVKFTDFVYGRCKNRLLL